MRFNPLALVAFAALSLAGCGAPVAPAFMASAGVEAQGGSITFDKTIVYKTIDILGIGATYEKKLAAQGIETVNDLLVAGATRTQRARLQKATGIPGATLLRFINHGDLMRVTGAGPEYARLLERAGVDTVAELARRNATNLADALDAANVMGGGKRLVHRVPDVVSTHKWVANAGAFARMIQY